MPLSKCVMCTSDVTESVFGEIFTTRSRINVALLIAHAQTLSSYKSPKMVSHSGNDHARLYRKTGALNSNMTSDFKPEVVIRSKLHMGIVIRRKATSNGETFHVV